MEEVWKIIDEHPEYAVSSLGRVRRETPRRGATVGKLLTPFIGPNGYPCITVYTHGIKRRRLVHQLVCRAFHGPKTNTLHQVAHGDGIRTNCAASNVSWKTWAGNVEDRIRHYPEIDHRPSELGTKRCSGCRRHKQLSEFSRNKASPHGYAYQCTVCAVESNRQYLLRKKLHK